MPRDTSTDQIIYDLLQRVALILAPLSGLGQVGGTGAAYPRLGLPQPQEPFPAIYCYEGGVQRDYSHGTSTRRDVVTVNCRVIGGPSTPNYRINPEDEAMKLINAIANELDYRPFLQAPSDGAPFRYVDPQGKVTILTASRPQEYRYGDLGGFIGCEQPFSVALIFPKPRLL
jgi:hypothetical protein